MKILLLFNFKFLKAFLTFVFSSVCLVSFAQAPVKQWDKTFGGTVGDNFRTVHQTADGGYILGGYSHSGISGDKTEAHWGFHDYWVVKVDASGAKEWDKTFGGNFGETLFSLFQTADGGYILGGYSQSGISGDKTEANRGDVDFWILKLNASGAKVWDKTVGGNGNDRLHRIIPTVDGGFIAAGASDSGISNEKTEPCKGFDDYWIVKFDTNGNKLWDKTFGTSTNDVLESIIQTSDGGYLLGGSSASGISGDKTEASKGGLDYWIVKVNSNGAKVWDKTIGGLDEDYFSSLIQTANGGYVLGGNSFSGISGDKSEANKGDSDYWIVQVSPIGHKLWDKTIGGNNNDFLSAILQTGNGNLILGGASFSGISGNKTQANAGSDFWLVKLDSTRTKIWDKTIGGSNSDFLYDIKQTSDNGFILGGYSDSGISGDKSETTRGFNDYWIVKLDAEVTGIQEYFTGFNLLVSPNPSQGNFNVQLDGLSEKQITISVSDLLGREVYKQELLSAGKQVSQELNLPVGKGIYLLQIKAGNKISTQKVIIN